MLDPRVEGAVGCPMVGLAVDGGGTGRAAVFAVFGVENRAFALLRFGRDQGEAGGECQRRAETFAPGRFSCRKSPPGPANST